MFKKSNRNFRTKKAEFDSDEEESNNLKQNESESIKTISKQVEIVLESKNNGKSISTSSTIKQSSIKVLSFNDGFEDENGNDNENGVEFKVRKSKESRRIAREVKKSRKEKDKPQNEPIKSSSKKNSNAVEDILFNEGIKIKPLKIIKSETTISSTTSRNVDQQKKYLMNKYKNEDSDEDFNNLSDKMIKSEDESEEDRDETSDQESTQLKRLREEMEVLTGEDMIPVDDEKDEAKRSMKLMLKSGIIPDANLIHAARKKREMARHGDYIPIGPDRSLQTKSKSRIIRYFIFIINNL
jgi:GC-rich sequence DNA-binding factor